jgi:ABC-type uncharacterized transport system substrate-binding protein
MNFYIKSLYSRTTSMMVIAFLLVTTIASCAPASSVTPATSETTPAAGENASTDFTGKKVVWINSYHEGYAWSDGIAEGLHSVLDGTGVEFKVISLDTKNNPDVEFGKAAGAQAWSEIQAFKPDVVIASDDNAQKYLVVPFIKETQTPVIFNGVNWDASAYGFPTANITGMIEVELPNQLVELLKGYAKGERVGYITIDTETERKSADTYNKRFFGGQMQTYWVKTQEEFKTAFVTAQQEVDILLIGNNAGSDAWDEAGMKQFILANTTIPTGSINDWMAPYSMLTLAKSSQEQGEWSAQAALSILGGTPASDIPVTENKKGQLIVNLDLADKLGVVFAPSLLKNAVILGE